MRLPGVSLLLRFALAILVRDFILLLRYEGFIHQSLEVWEVQEAELSP